MICRIFVGSVYKVGVGFYEFHPVAVVELFLSWSVLMVEGIPKSPNSMSR